MALQKPNQITVPFASSGVKNTIPETATGSNLASMQEGFPTVTMTDVDQGGMPPQGQDMNGILFDVTTAIRYQQAGGLFPYDATFASKIDGYPIGALLTSADGTKIFQNMIDGNQSDPENGGQNWNEILTSTAIAGKQDALNAAQLAAVNSGITAAKVAEYDGYATGKQDTLTFDNTPTEGSLNPVTSDGIATALSLKQDNITVDAVPTSGSTNPVQSGGVYDALAEKVNIDNAGNAEVTATGSTTARTLANRFSDVINVKDFGAKGDGVTDDTAAIQAAIDAVTPKGKSLFFPAGTYIVSSTLTIYADTHIQGESMYSTIFKLKDNSDCTIFKTYKFDEFNVNGGDETTNYPDLPVNFSIQDIQIDGNRMSQFSGTGVTDAAYVGDGILLYGRSYIVNNVYIHDVAGNGFHTALRYQTGTISTDYGVRDFNSSYINHLYVFKTSYEGFVFEGPGDILIDDVLVGFVFAPNTSLTAPVGTSLLFPGESIDGIVFASYDPPSSSAGDPPAGNGTAEIGFIHAYNCRQGYAVRMTGCRINADNVHGEGGIGCIKIDDVIGGIDKIGVRYNISGTANRAALLISSQQMFNVGIVNAFKTSVDTNGRTNVELNAPFTSIDEIKIAGNYLPGHGVDIQAISSIGSIVAHNCQGATAEGSSVYSKAIILRSAAQAKIDYVNIRNCDIAIENNSTNPTEISGGQILRGAQSSTNNVRLDTDQIVMNASVQPMILQRWGFTLWDVVDQGIQYPSFLAQQDVTLNGTTLVPVYIPYRMWRVPAASEVKVSWNSIRSGMNYSVSQVLGPSDSSHPRTILVYVNAASGVTNSIRLFVSVGGA